MGATEVTDRDNEAPLNGAARRRFYLYLLPILFFPALMLIAACWIVPSRWMLLHARNSYLTNLGYGATLRGADCQIVVYGDSSAMVGVDPSVLSRETGLTACNIAEFEGMTILNGTMVLDDYLAQNRPPRFLVFVYTPEDFDPATRRNEVGMFEAITWRMGQPGKLKDLAAVMRHPEEFFTWAEQGLRLAVERSQTPEASLAVQNIRADHDGQLPVSAPAMTSCGGPSTSARNHPDRAWVQGLRSKYGAGGIDVLVDPMSVPDCDAQLAQFRQQLAGVADETVETLPVNVFTTDGRLHMNAEGANLFSQRIAEQIRKLGAAPAPVSRREGR